MNVKPPIIANAFESMLKSARSCFVLLAPIPESFSLGLPKAHTKDARTPDQAQTRTAQIGISSGLGSYTARQPLSLMIQYP